MIETELINLSPDVSALCQVLLFTLTDLVVGLLLVKADHCPRKCQDVILWIILEIAHLYHAIVIGVRGVILEGEELMTTLATPEPLG